MLANEAPTSIPVKNSMRTLLLNIEVASYNESYEEAHEKGASSH
jgi:hypothetical protein